MEPASIRYKNPGAMWGSSLAIKWGASHKAVSLHDGKGQGNNIAIFPTFVQGICAQLDLWRTSKNYRNKRFVDAIAIWSGHNEVSSYIAFCKARVPGLTESTIMDDAFWRSPSGIAFLKAQAWHEAGKKYPAPDADWIEAQRRVFAGAVSFPASHPVQSVDRSDAPPSAVVPAAAPVVIAPSVPGDPELYSVQTRLKAMNFSPGLLDGKWGGGTSGAISAFINDRGGHIPVPASLDAFNDIREELKAELQRAEAENWKRPVTEARRSGDATTVAAVAPEVVPVKRNYLLTAWTGAGTFLYGVYNALGDSISQAWEFFTDHKDDLPSDPGYLSTAWDYAQKVPTTVWIFVAAGGLVFLALNSRAGVKKITEQVQTGARQ